MELRWRGSKASLMANLRKLPSVLAGKAPDPHGLRELFLSHIGRAALRCIAEDFDVKKVGGEGRDGESWAPLSEYTLRRREAKGVTHGEILRETDALRNALEPDDAVRPFGQIFEMEGGVVTVGVDDEAIPYAKFHQEGAPHMPARKITPEGDMPTGWERDMNEAVERGLQAVLDVMCERGGVG